MSAFNSRAKAANDHGNRLATAGLALETLANLLEQDLNEGQIYGLTCAISSIGALVRDAGFTLCAQVEKEARK